MIRRVLAAAFAACLALPADIAAQPGTGTAAQPTPPRFHIAPFAGHLTGFVRKEQWTHRTGDNVHVMDVDVHIGGGPGAGMTFEARLAGLWGVTAAAGFFQRAQTHYVVLHSGETRRADGANVLIGRLGAVFQMPSEESEFVLRRLEAAAFAGGVVLHERTRNTLGTGAALGNATQFGANVGLAAGLPFANDRFAVQVAIEDNIVFWRDEPLARLAREHFRRPGAAPAQTSVNAGTSHTWLLRAGISARF